MKKTLATIWLAWMLVMSPKAPSQTSSKIEERKKDLVEAMTQQQTAPEEGKTITFQEAQKLQEQQKLMEEIMNNEKIQGLINEYWQEEVERTISEIFTNEDSQELIEKLLEDEKIQQALKEWDQEAVTKRVEEIIQKHKKWTFWMQVVDKLPTAVCSTILWIYIGKSRRY